MNFNIKNSCKNSSSNQQLSKVSKVKNLIVALVSPEHESMPLAPWGGGQNF